jgi:hypothetical protein
MAKLQPQAAQTTVYRRGRMYTPRYAIPHGPVSRGPEGEAVDSGLEEELTHIEEASAARVALDEDLDDFEYVPVPPKIEFTTWITFVYEGRRKPDPYVFDDDDE